MSSLQNYLEHRVLLVTQDGRVIVGMLRGYDAGGSIVLSDCVERIFSTDVAVEQVPLGVYVMRGDSISLLGDVDVNKDRALDLSNVMAEPMPVTRHT
ncbi:hypothetical protein MVES_000862 [Malassezia vespertilionis]|uniref:LSM2-LSM8 complex subunit LSM8 n=1 Tax=Malassezia vespertilionis TaxID=2020962 RepID=A0A2N1JE51_9BASI|nr:hypothetical protein MVES_000862 [Malassezia vespertilionis]